MDVGTGRKEIIPFGGPHTTVNEKITPNGVNAIPKPTHTLIVRQDGKNAREFPFIAVFEPYNEGEQSINKWNP